VAIHLSYYANKNKERGLRKPTNRHCLVVYKRHCNGRPYMSEAILLSRLVCFKIDL